MDIKRMHSEIKLRYNKLNSNHKKDLPTPYIDDILNIAQSDFVDICYSGNSSKIYKLGFEFTQQRIDMISSLVIPNEVIVPTLFSTNIYKVNFSNLAHNYRHFLSAFVNSSCGKIKLTVVPHLDIEGMLINENTKPSKVWRTCLATMTGDTSISGNQSLLIYTGGEFTPTSVSITYLKEPRKVYFGGYDTYEYINGDLTAPNTGDPQIDCELPETGLSHSLVVDIATQLIARSIEDVQKISIIEDKITRTI